MEHRLNRRDVDALVKIIEFAGRDPELRANAVLRSRWLARRTQRAGIAALLTAARVAAADGSAAVNWIRGYVDRLNDQNRTTR